DHTAPYRRPLRIAEYGDPDKDAAFFAEISPARHVDRIKAPLLVVQGGNDPIVPASESEQIVKKIKAQGGTVQYLLLPDQGQGLAKLSNRLRAFEEMDRFLEQVLSTKKDGKGARPGEQPRSSR